MGLIKEKRQCHRLEMRQMRHYKKWCLILDLLVSKY